MTWTPILWSHLHCPECRSWCRRPCVLGATSSAAVRHYRTSPILSRTKENTQREHRDHRPPPKALTVTSIVRPVGRLRLMCVPREPDQRGRRASPPPTPLIVGAVRDTWRCASLGEDVQPHTFVWPRAGRLYSNAPDQATDLDSTHYAVCVLEGNFTISQIHLYRSKFDHAGP